MCDEKNLAFFGVFFQIIDLPLQPILKKENNREKQIWQKT
jgi:hypothetical protein